MQKLNILCWRGFVCDLVTVHVLNCFVGFECDELESLENGAVSKLSNSVGSVASYSCEPGFMISGPRERVCQLSAASWTGVVGFCDQTDPVTSPHALDPIVLSDSKTPYPYIPNPIPNPNPGPNPGRNSNPVWGGSLNPAKPGLPHFVKV